MDSLPANSNNLSYFNGFFEEMNSYLESGDQFFASLFSEISESCSDTLSLENKMVVKVEDCSLPDEIVKIIISQSPVQLRLSLLQKISRQFYNLCLPFAIDCHHLHSMIPKIRDAVAPGITQNSFFVLTFEDNKIISIFKAIFPPIKMTSGDYKIVWQDNCNVLEDHFNFDDFQKEVEKLLEEDLVSIGYKTILDENNPSFELNEYNYKKIRIYRLVANLIKTSGKDFIEKLAALLIRFSQKILLEDKDDFGDLEEIVLQNCSTLESKIIFLLIKLIFNHAPEEQWKRFKSHPRYQEIKGVWLDYLAVSQDKLVVKIEEFIETFTFKPKLSKSLFFLDKFNGVIAERSLRQFIPENSDYSDVQLWFSEQLFPHATVL